MKSVIIADCILIIIVIAIIFCTVYINKTSDTVAQELEQLYDDARTENWGEATVQLEKVKQAWKQRKAVMQTLFDHMELDNIEISLVKVEQYVIFNDLENSVAEIATAKMLVEHLPNKDSLNISNIL